MVRPIGQHVITDLKSGKKCKPWYPDGSISIANDTLEVRRQIGIDVTLAFVSAKRITPYFVIWDGQTMIGHYGHKDLVTEIILSGGGFPPQPGSHENTSRFR